MSINSGHRINRPSSLFIGIASDKNPVGSSQILHRRALGKKFRVGYHLIGMTIRGFAEDFLDHLSGAYRNGRLLDNDLVPSPHFCNPAGARIDVSQISSLTRSGAIVLGGRIDADENDLRISQVVIDFSGEEKIPAPGLLNDLEQTGFVNG